MRTKFLNPRPKGISDPVVLVIPTRWMQELRSKFGDQVMRDFAGISYSFDYNFNNGDEIDWRNYGFGESSPSIAASAANLDQLVGWIDAAAFVTQVDKSDLAKIVPMRVLQGWDIGIGDPVTIQLESLLEQTEEYDQVAYYIHSGDLIEVLARAPDQDGSFRLAEAPVYDDGAGLDEGLPDWETDISGYLPKGWYTLTTRSKLSGDPESINYQVLSL